ncbi:class I adenylate-forming enzyme family protein [Goodfellowiella coeruleoviolacea]|uniref:AMP-binding enzyme n=1 Tax=Goodfellowiella coeruleoviolacea TaxID=334858 RepID=A0AAE3GMI4_9PSEU|nr:hypothetical protein [Goodfellowiella coeruleoviolacea]MCP2170268.1 AMP-binding enzyme [Goodfellowiella coeruleoviolacea]
MSGAVADTRWHGAGQVDRWLDVDLDEWTSRVVRRTFDPALGSPYWLRRAKELTFDPRDITRYDELTAFGPFPLDDLRTGRPVDLVPLAVRRPLTCRVWETGGTTGDPCRVVYTDAMLDHYATWRRWAAGRAGFERGRTWLRVTPSGPHLIGHCAWLAEGYDAEVHTVDFDPRWVKRELRQGRVREAQEYTDHVLDQGLLILKAQPIDYLFTTPALFRTLIRRAPGVVSGLSGALLGGTHVTPEMRMSFVDAMPGGRVTVSYGNTFGSASALPVVDDGRTMPHVPHYPQVTMAVVDRADWQRRVGYGQYGRLRLTVLHEDLFLPNILERDLVMRYDTGDVWPCDGIANVRPLQEIRAAPEGVY